MASVPAIFSITIDMPALAFLMVSVFTNNCSLPVPEFKYCRYTVSGSVPSVAETATTIASSPVVAAVAPLFVAVKTFPTKSVKSEIPDLLEILI